MERSSTSDLDLDLDLELDLEENSEERLVREWRAEQLRRLGLPPLMALAFADIVDWHDLAALVRRGCPPILALEIVR
jgi:class 3 adenylate cyclase